MHECVESMCVVDVRSDPIGECCGVVYVLRECERPHYDFCVKEYKISTRLAALLRLLLHCRLLHRLLELQPQAVGHTLLAR